jgi:hypothetical protein
MEDGRMALWDQIKKGAEEGLEVLKEGMAIFMAEAGKQSKIIRKRVELSVLQNNVRKAFIHLGVRIYDLQTQGEKEYLEEGEIKDLIAQIDSYKSRVREIELEIEAMKREESSRTTSRSTDKKTTPPEAQH